MSQTRRRAASVGAVITCLCAAALAVALHSATGGSVRADTAAPAVAAGNLDFRSIPGARFVEVPVGPRLPSGTPVIPMTQAARVALENFDPRGSFPAVRITAQLGDFSDDQYARVSGSGQRQYYFQGRPAWIIAFTGLDIPPVGGPPRPGEDPATLDKLQQAQMHHEEDVVVDAVTGQYLEQFTFR